MISRRRVAEREQANTEVLVIDANILIRAVLGVRFRSLIVKSFETYRSFELAARTRLASRDPDDWPVLATALALSSPIWTEDNDFFGAGVATWTTDRVELFLGAAAQSE